MVIWITGLSGSGKTTLAKEVIAQLKNDGLRPISLDGDEMREVFINPSEQEDKHDRSTRLALALRYSSLASLLSKQGFVVVVATISLFHLVHEWNSANISEYFEVYLDTPISELKRRDSKQIYSKYESGKICNVIGLDLPFEKPIQPNFLIEFDSTKSTKSISLEILQQLKLNFKNE